MEHSSSVQFRAGELIFRQGDPPDGAYLIESGRVVITADHLGEARLLSELGPGMLLGEMAVLDRAPRTASARALSDCRLTPIGVEQFSERLVAADPIVRALLMSQLARYRSALATLTETAAAAKVAPEIGTEARALDKIRLESQLRSALDRRELEVYLQPIAEIGGAVAGYEALVRWHHPERGSVPPDEFIRLAEETSLILPVGDYILADVCGMLDTLRARGRGELPFIALNLSARQLEDPGLVARIFSQLERRALPPDRLKLEITESLVFDNARIATLLGECHAVGMPVALDDFGTGYSNLGPLLSLDFDQIKLDASFVRSLDQPRALALVGTVVAMARALGADLIAEGVETRAQYDVLAGLGCRYAQGWLIGKPAPLARVLEDRLAAGAGD